MNSKNKPEQRIEISLKSNGKIKRYIPTGTGYLARKANETGVKEIRIITQQKYNSPCWLYVKYSNNDIHLSFWNSRSVLRNWLKRKSAFKYLYIPYQYTDI